METPFIHITLERIDDGSELYNSLKPYELHHEFNAVRASIDGYQLIFSAGGHGYLFDLDYWRATLTPVV